MNIWMVLTSTSFTIFFVVMFIIEKVRHQKTKIHVIKLLENILNEGENHYQCYADFEMSRIEFLLNKIEVNNRTLIENAYKDKEGIKNAVASLSHQLKTPLTNIKIYENLLEEETLSNSKRNFFQNKLRIQIEKIEWILDSIIKCAMLEEDAIDFKASMLPIRKTIMQAMDSVELKAKMKHIEIISKYEFNDVELFHNHKWTVEVFTNILENAIKYSHENSIIELELERLDNYSRIAVKDAGIGIKECEYAKVFQRFYRSKEVENKEGLGIGLYLCRLILEKEKGDIVVKSTHGKGSTFYVYLLNKNPEIINLNYSE